MPSGRRLGGAAIAALLLFWGPSARSADPEEAQYNVVVTLYNAGQWQAALKKIEEREAQPLSAAMQARYLYARGLALEAGRKTADARAAYTAVLDRFPQAPEGDRARLSLVYLDYAARDYRSVVSNGAALKMDALPAAEKPKVALMQAESQAALKDLPAAAAFYRQALALGADRAAVAPKLFGLYQALQRHAELLDLAAAGVPGVADDVLAAVRAESLLALNRAGEAEAAARAVPDGSPLHPRASFTLAQALIRQNRLPEAAAPLALAVRELRDPPAPVSARLALAECLLADAKPAEAGKAADEALRRIESLPEPEQPPLRQQGSLLRVRAALALKEPRQLLRVVNEARPCLPADKLPDILYARLYALHEAQDPASVLKTLKDDLPVLEGKPQEGNAVLIYFAAHRLAGGLPAGCALLEAYIARRPDTPEATKARLELANEALVRGDDAQADERLRDLLARPAAAAHLGPEAYAEARFNASAVALKRGDPSAAAAGLEQLCALKPPRETLGKGLYLLGQIHAQTGNWAKAAAAWSDCLAQGGGGREAEVRDRLGRALAAAGRPAEARVQFEALAASAGTNKLSRETREAWARALYALADYTNAAALYQALHREAGASPEHAYECAVCLERLEQWTEAEAWYRTAEKGKEALPEAYAKGLAQALSRIQYKTGTGDRGFAYWMTRLEPEAPDADFDAAAPLLARLLGEGAADAAAGDALEALMLKYGTEHPRRYGVGALALQAAAARKEARLGKRAAPLAVEYAAAEPKLPAGAWSTTVAPAMIHFYKGEADRLAGRRADALVAYETVLAAYPYNEWPDAAACGAAECYADLGDEATAAAKLRDVVQAAANAKTASKWVDYARARLAELEQAKGDKP